MNKYFTKLAVIDGSYWLHRSLKQPNLWELKDENGHHTGGIFGFLRLLTSELRNIDHYPVVCWDAGLDKRRLELLPNYKHNFDKIVERASNKVAYENMSHEDAIEDFKWKLSNQQVFDDAVEAIRDRVAKLLEEGADFEYTDPKDDYGKVYHDSRVALIEILEYLGIPSIYVPGAEGDDLMTLCTRISESNIVMTDDRDLIQLVSPDTRIYRPMAKEWIIYDDYMRELGIQSSNELIYHKAIIGDPSDNIPSVTHGLERKYALGGKRAYHITKIIHESGEDPNVYLPRIKELNKNYYNGFVMNHEIFIRNMGMVDLRLVPNDPDVIATIVNKITEVCGKTKLFRALGKLGEYQITDLDLNSIIMKVTMMAPFIIKGGN